MISRYHQDFPVDAAAATHLPVTLCALVSKLHSTRDRSLCQDHWRRVRHVFPQHATWAQLFEPNPVLRPVHDVQIIIIIFILMTAVVCNLMGYLEQVDQQESTLRLCYKTPTTTICHQVQSSTCCVSYLLGYPAFPYPGTSAICLFLRALHPRAQCSYVYPAKVPTSITENLTRPTQ